MPVPPGATQTHDAGGLHLDVRPIPQPINAYAWMAGQLRAQRYTTEKERDAAAEAVAWMDRLAQLCTGPEHSSREPIVLAVLSRAAMDAHTRANTLRALARLEEVIAAEVEREQV